MKHPLRENADEMLKYVQKTISSYDKLIKEEEDTSKLSNLRKKKDELQSKLSMFNSLLCEMNKQKKLGSRVEDSLRPITYIRKHIDEVISSPDTIELLDLLENQLKQIKDKEQIPSVLPPDFEDRYQELKQEFKHCQSELMRLTSLRKTIGDPVWLNRALRIKYRLRDLKKPSKDTYQLSVAQDKQSQIDSLKIRLQKIHQLPRDVKAVLYPYINHYFQSEYGAISSYPGASMQYSDEERRVSLLKDGEEYPVRNIGSKSNYMFLHLCFFLGLHKSFLDKKSKQVGSFLFIDQPSIPYYADRARLDNDDKKQLKKALCLLNDFMMDVVNHEDKHFQIILIEHAEESYWEGLEFFHTVAVFSKAENGGLIPKHIYE